MKSLRRQLKKKMNEIKNATMSRKVVQTDGHGQGRVLGPLGHDDEVCLCDLRKRARERESGRESANSRSCRGGERSREQKSGFDFNLLKHGDGNLGTLGCQTTLYIEILYY